MFQKNQDIYLIPYPRKIEINKEYIQLDDSWIIQPVDFNKEDLFSCRLLANEIKINYGFELKIGRLMDRSSLNNIQISRITAQSNEDKLFNEQGYLLTIKPNQIEIKAVTAQGIFYGIQTLRQLIRCSEDNKLPCMSIKDYPVIRWRGISDDISRGQISTIKGFIELIEDLAFYKINLYQPYIEDVYRFDICPDIGRDSGGLTKEEMKQIVQTAKLYHVEICPILECLGHQKKLLNIPINRKYAERQDSRLIPWSFSITLSPTRNFVKKLIDELVEVTPGSKYFHIGCDESYDLGEGASKNDIQKKGVGHVLGNYINELIDYIQRKHHREVMYYGDMILRHPESAQYLNPDGIIIDWQYEPVKEYPSIKKIKNIGLKKIMASPAVMGALRFYPDYQNSFLNIGYLAAAAKKENLEGFIISGWGDNGSENLRNNNLPGFVYGGAVSWQNQQSLNPARFLNRFVRIHYGINKTAIALLQAYKTLCFGVNYDKQINPCVLFHAQPKLVPINPDKLKKIKKLQRIMLDADKNIKMALPEVRFHKYHLEILAHVVKRFLFLSNKSIVLNKSNITNEHNRLMLGKELEQLRNNLLDIIAQYTQLWLQENKYPGLEFNLNRLQLQIADYQNILSKIYLNRLTIPSKMNALWFWHPYKIEQWASLTGIRYFIRKFQCVEPLKSAELTAWADDSASIYINGNLILTVTDKERPKSVSCIDYLKKGENMLAICAINGLPAPAAVVMELKLQFQNGKETILTGDKNWLCSKIEFKNWNTHWPIQNKKLWKKIQIMGKGFQSPWGDKIDWPENSADNLPEKMK